MTNLNIWDLEDYQCPVVGTCLTMADLSSVARKCGLCIDADATDYEIHGYFVGQAKCPGSIGKALQKLLNKKHRRSLVRFRKLKTDEDLMALWRDCVDKGNVPGPFWAVLSHPCASPGLRNEIFGEVHMLSHVLGAANHADLKRLNAMERENTRLKEALAERKTVLRDAVAVWKRRYRELEQRLADERRERQQELNHRTDLGDTLREGAVQVALTERDALAEQQAHTASELLQSQSVVERQAASIERLTAEIHSLRAALSERDDTVAILEHTLAQALESADGIHDRPREDGDCDCEEGCPGGCADCPKLRGKSVLYVGGRCNLAPHYRRLASKYGCELLLHDGGVEQSPQHLNQLLAKADAVICPVTCVSHEACTLVKRTCKGCLKPLCLPSSSGLGGLERSLCELEKTVQ